MISELHERVRRRYALQIAVAILVVVLVVAGVGAATLVVTDAELSGTVESTMISQSRAEASGVDDWLDTQREFTRLVSNTEYVTANDTESVRRGLRDALANTRNGDVLAVYVIDRGEGNVVAAAGSTTPSPEDPYWDRLFFQNFADVATTHPYTTGSQSAIAFTSPVESNTSRLLVVVADTDGVTNRFESPYGDGFTTVVDSGGTVVFGTYPVGDGTQYGDANETPLPVRQGLRGHSGFQDEFATESDLGSDHVRAYAPVAATDWVVIKHASSQNAYALSRTIRNSVLALIGIVLVGAVLAYGLVGWRTTSTLGSLARRARAVADGEHDTSLAVDRDDEFGDLGVAIADMRDELVARIAAVERTERHLRTLVENLPAALVAYDATGTITVVEGRDMTAIATAADVGGDATVRLANGEVADAVRTALDGDPVSTTVELAAGTYHLWFSPTADDAGVVVAHDVTERVTHEQRIEVLNRVLRHDVRNRLNVVLGEANALRDHVESDAGERALDSLISEAERVVTLSEEARTAQAVIESETTPVDVSESVENAIEWARSSHDDLTVHATVEPDCWADATIHVGRAVEELITLARERVPHDQPVSVTVEVATRDDSVVVAVSDDGRPIPDEERRSVERGTENPLEHVSGVGLWLVYWTITLGGGELAIEDAPAGGATVICRFRATDPEPDQPQSEPD